MLALTAVLLLCGLTLLWNGLTMHSDYRQLGLAGCLPGGHAPHCSARLDAFSSDQTRATQLVAVMLPLPVLFGLFLGAPLLAREFESGSYRFAFTQGVGRTRWLAAKITLLGAFTAIAALAFTLIVVWWYGPLVGLNGRLGAGTIYEIYGPVFVARALFAFCFGVLLGSLLRRVVPAMGATLAAWVAVVAASITLVRSHLLPPLTAINTAVPGKPWVLTDTWTSPDGHLLNRAEISDLQFNAAAAGHKLDRLQYLRGQGYRHVLIYQPADRFWTLQLIEGAPCSCSAPVPPSRPSGSFDDAPPEPTLK